MLSLAGVHLLLVLGSLAWDTHTGATTPIRAISAAAMFSSRFFRKSEHVFPRTKASGFPLFSALCYLVF